MTIEFELSNDAILEWVRTAKPLSDHHEYTYTGKLALSVNDRDVSKDLWVTVELCEYSAKLCGRLEIVETRKFDDGVTCINDTHRHDQFSTKYTLSQRESDLFQVALETRLMIEGKLNTTNTKQQKNE